VIIPTVRRYKKVHQPLCLDTRPAIVGVVACGPAIAGCKILNPPL